MSQSSHRSGCFSIHLIQHVNQPISFLGSSRYLLQAFIIYQTSATETDSGLVSTPWIDPNITSMPLIESPLRVGLWFPDLSHRDKNVLLKNSLLAINFERSTWNKAVFVLWSSLSLGSSMIVSVTSLGLANTKSMLIVRVEGQITSRFEIVWRQSLKIRRDDGWSRMEEKRWCRRGKDLR